MAAVALALPTLALVAPQIHRPTSQQTIIINSAQATEQRIQDMIHSSKVMLFMKGTKMFPQCGFSNTAVAILNALEQPYETFDVLSDESVREGIKRFSNWPTIPQCYIDGEFIGGCDLLIEMYESGELAEMVERAHAS